MSSDTVTRLGDVCPPWCGGEHVVERDLHPEDDGVYHDSARVDTWMPESPDAREAIDVWVHGYRHDDGEDWPDEVMASNVHPGFVSGLGLNVPDARRLAYALLKACDLAEAKQEASAHA